MKMLAGVALGILLCAVFPDLPYSVKDWINELAQTVADATDPTFTERAEEALTDWRNQ